MKRLTIFTPTYNRAYCLDICYESLVKQTNKDFLWMIIDDGSSDNTREIVEKWIKENLVQIQYIKQENQGMHGAHNTAYENIQTELNICIDSDDYMPVDGVEKILHFWDKYGSEQVSGIIGLDSFRNGKVIGTRLPEHLEKSTLFNLYNKHQVKGDKKLVLRTELTRKYPYPIFENEKYVGLAYKYHKLDEVYPMLLMNEVLCIVEYLPDGSSLNMLKQYRNNPNGFAFYRKELMKLSFVDLKFKFRQAIHYVSSSILSKNGNFMKESPEKLLTLMALPFGLLLYFFIMSKTNMQSNRLKG
ncbi:glycosyltransferase family 2 protein [Metabacillus endolithicus]|uniref:Glycosyltransferase family 2 protein n=1 Tax=Metabacillus endolithicus TaxID=1535204 RepID=A0ABW5BVR5_9BACI|nr:glycosyltransferase family 2 protein [Metabacillus endolithicus]UPG64509.1 glycosyltransferase family 2 protein [Metabacillus endolithicus]